MGVFVTETGQTTPMPETSAPPIQEKKFEFRGELSATPLPEVLETINRYRVPGVLDCMREGWNRKIFIQGGEITFATSNNLEDSLGDFLLRAGRLTRDQYDQSVVLLKATRKRQGVVLVEMGVLTPKELFSAVVDQVRQVVWDTFNWESGDVSFSVGRFREDEIIKLHIPTRSAILGGVEAVRDPRPFTTRLGSSWTVYEPTWEVGDLTELDLDEARLRLLNLVDGKRTLLDLSKDGPFPQAMNARILYAFNCLRLIRRREERGIRIHYRTPGGQMTSGS
jgi:hypothetical protein